MKNLISLLTLPVMLGLVASCASDEPVLQKNLEETNKNFETKVSKDDAVKIANVFLDNISPEQTRAGHRSVSKIDVVLNDTPTRAAQSDTLLYIINFDNNEGYAIVSADTRAYPVFAMSDTGCFEINDDTNEGVKLYLENAKETVIKMSSQNSEGFNPSELSVSPVNKSVKPLISERQARVGNCPALNKYVTDEEGNPYQTCCAPVAIEIAMSYHKWPTRLEGYVFNWDAMNAGLDDDGIARLLAILSSKGYCQVHDKINKHGIREYYTFTADIIPTFIKCGYTADYEGFKVFNRDNDMVYEHLTKSGPLLIDGRGENKDGETEGGHAWILDGYTETFYKPIDSDFAAFILGTFYHCVWGNPYGGCNGYYLASDTKYFDGAPDFYDNQDAGNNLGEECWHFKYYEGAIKYFGNFKPKYFLIQQ